MKGIERLVPVFVEDIPEHLGAGVLYVSPAHATMLHLCACGCGQEVVLPLSPTDWRLSFDGETLSVHPSVGNWSLPCRSHYVIDHSQVRWAGDWTEEKIRQGRENDRRRKAARYGEPTMSLTPESVSKSLAAPADAARSAKLGKSKFTRRVGVIARALRWLSGRRRA